MRLPFDVSLEPCSALFRNWRATLLAWVGSGCALAASAVAAPPKLEWIFPAGGSRAEAFEVTAGGELGDAPVSAWCDSPELQLTPLEQKGKFRVEPNADALPGVYWVRMANQEGASALRPIVLGELLEVTEEEPNDGPERVAATGEVESGEEHPEMRWGQPVALPATVNGRLGKSGDVDAFEVSLEAGQTLVARLQANAVLGSPVDAVLQVCHPVRQVTSALAGLPPRVDLYVIEQTHDARGLDPLLEFRAERAGTYVVRVFGFPSAPNSTIGFAGGDPLIYRLTLATEGVVEYAMPMPVAAGSETAPQVRLFGAGIDPSGIDAVARRLAKRTPSGEKSEPPQQSLTWRAFAPGKAGVVDLPATSLPTVEIASLPESEAGLSDAADVALPVVASGRVAAAGEVAAVRVAGSQGETLRVALESRQLGFALDPVVVVRDADGKVLERKDSGSNRGDVAFEFKPPADGVYQIEVRDLHGRGGARFVYRLAIEPVKPTFALSLAGDSFVVKPGEAVEIPVAVERRGGFAEPITVRCAGLPAGVEADPVISQGEGDTAKEVKLVLRAAADAQPAHGGPLRIEGSAASDTESRQVASFALNLPFAGTHTAAWLTVAE